MSQTFSLVPEVFGGFILDTRDGLAFCPRRNESRRGGAGLLFDAGSELLDRGARGDPFADDDGIEEIDELIPILTNGDLRQKNSGGKSPKKRSDRKKMNVRDVDYE